jgi:tetraacyldisaccharide-1-P 4'-kinase
MKFYKYILNFLTNESKKPENAERIGDRSGGRFGNFLKFCAKLPLIILSFAVIAFSKIKRAAESFRAKESGLFTISFGNINMGGSGKTPFSYSLAEYLYEKQLKPCIITRGYKGRLKKKSI